jgi:signal transduction histidine kinase
MALRSRVGRPGIADVGTAAALVVGVAVELVLDPDFAADRVNIAATILGCVVVGARRVAPLGVSVVTALLGVGFELFTPGGETSNSPLLFAAVLLVAYGGGAYATGLRSVASLASLLIGDLVTILHGELGAASDWSAGMIVYTALWIVGVGVRRTRGRAQGLEHHLATVERDIQRREREAVDVERARIARELHDVIAHSVALMTVQAGAAESTLERDPDRTRGALHAIQETGGRTVEDLRRLLGLLRAVDGSSTEPEAGLAGVEALAGRITAAGLDVDVEVHGERVPISPGLDATAYRIVQEALTNTLRHANARRARVLIYFESHLLRLVVEDDGTGAPESAAVGHGLVGMRERAGVFGGALHFGSRRAGGFQVVAELPLSGGAS